ncbi:MAG: flagellar hook-basal body complex protein [Bacillota bacterium]|jgi:flagellar hook protein FlgE
MIRSLSAGVSGLRNHQIRMDVIANNIANVNATAFKMGRVNFQEVLSQNIRGNSASNIGVDSVNPAQIGLGMTVQSIDMLFGQGSPTTTNRVLDIMIDGNGFFRLGRWGGTSIIEYSYTRDGSFYVNNEGYLVNAAGLHVLGVGEASRLNPTDIANVNAGTYTVPAGPGERIRIFDPAAAPGGPLPNSLTTLRIDPNGLVYINGQMDRAALILVDNYSNPENLSRLGGNLYEVPLTGTPPVPYNQGWGVPGGTGGQGKLLSGALEMSNVDLSTEFANMITTQRGFQANARVITVSDEMLQELINLKR